MSLESLVKQIDAAGQAWVEAKLKADQLEEDQAPFLSSLMNGINDELGGNVSDAKLKRLALGSTEYRQYITGMVTAKAEALRKQVRYNATKDKFEAARSDQSLEKAKIEKGIFHEGR